MKPCHLLKFVSDVVSIIDGFAILHIRSTKEVEFALHCIYIKALNLPQPYYYA